jgi:hypothetical protein
MTVLRKNKVTQDMTCFPVIESRNILQIKFWVQK